MKRRQRSKRKKAQERLKRLRSKVENGTEAVEEEDSEKKDDEDNIEETNDEVIVEEKNDEEIIENGRSASNVEERAVVSQEEVEEGEQEMVISQDVVDNQESEGGSHELNEGNEEDVETGIDLTCKQLDKEEIEHNSKKQRQEENSQTISEDGEERALQINENIIEKDEDELLEVNDNEEDERPLEIDEGVEDSVDVVDYSVREDQDDDMQPQDLSMKKVRRDSDYDNYHRSTFSSHPAEGKSERSRVLNGLVKEDGSEEDSNSSLSSPSTSGGRESGGGRDAGGGKEAQVVAQLNQLQQTVMSHILQYQAGVMAQFQQLQQQMLSQLSPESAPVQPAPASRPSRKRPAALISTDAPPQPEVKPKVEVQLKRKRTAFDAKQYKILETTFEHNNFPEPMEQQCIAVRIKTPYRSIKMWFQNRRAAIRKRMSPKEKGANAAEKGKNASDPDARWYCTQCPSTFISKRFLETHREAHEKETLHCPECNMAFTHKVLLETHKISKCSKTGVELSHLEDEMKEPKTKKTKRKQEPKPKLDNLQAGLQSALPLIMLHHLQQQQQQQQLLLPKHEPQEEPLQLTVKKETPPNIPPLIPADSLLDRSNIDSDNQQEDTDDQDGRQDTQDHQHLNLQTPQQRFLQQLLLAQLHNKVQEEARREEEEEEEREDSRPASPKDSLTVGGLTIFPVKSSPEKPKERIRVKVKEELEAPTADLDEPSTLQDQIASILLSQGMKSPWKPAIKSEHDESQESMQDQISAILRSQEHTRKKADRRDAEDGEGSSSKRHRRRTTVFNEVQLRTLYMHFTHCNFPDPSMFKIIGHLTKLEPQVIKIWFQNERSRQRKRATHVVDEANSKEKPYKCRDCGMSFAMLTFLVKHSMRHNGDTDQDEFVRTCPLCLQKWSKDVFSSHLKSRHNVNLSLVEEKTAGNLVCFLCKENFPDQESLMIHKHKHLKDDYGDPPECKECKTTFVNAICLEAHMETHSQKEWTFKCSLCGALFHDKVLLVSHRMGHGVPLAPVSTTDRSRSQMQHTAVRSSLGQDQKPTNLPGLVSPPSSSESEPAVDLKIVKSEPNTPITPQSSSKVVSSNVPTIISPTIVSPSFISTTGTATSTVNTIPFSSAQGPVSYVKLIPVQLIPVNSLAGQKSTTTTTTAPTTTFISVPVSIQGSSDTTNPILSQLLDPASTVCKATDKVSSEKAKTKTLPNLIPIAQCSSIVPKLKAQVESPCKEVKQEDKGALREGSHDGDEENLPPLPVNLPRVKKMYVNGIEIEYKTDHLPLEEQKAVQEQTSGANKLAGLQVTIKKEAAEEPPAGDSSPALVGSKKRFVPILPLLRPGEGGSADTSGSQQQQQQQQQNQQQNQQQQQQQQQQQRPRSTRNVANKRLWQNFESSGYKRRRTPTYFTGNQREILEAHFDHDNFPEPSEQMAIGSYLGVEYAVIKTWFQNNRKNYRKTLKEDNKFEDDGPFHCQKCNVSFIASSMLTEHQGRHATPAEWECVRCGVPFAHKAVLDTHMLKHQAKTVEPQKKKKVGPFHLLSSSQRDSALEESDTSDTESMDEEPLAEEDKEKLQKYILELQKEGKNAQKDGGEKEGQEVQRSDEDGEDYHPIMAVECILNDSDEDEGRSVVVKEEPSKSGHTCGSCSESFASLIALKEHETSHCTKKKFLVRPAGGHWRRRRKKSKSRKFFKIGNEIRCFDCQRIFRSRSSYLEHCTNSKCNVGRQRIEYTDEEQKTLVAHYDANNFPLPSEMSLVAKRLGVRYRQIMHWFQNRRSKERKLHKGETKHPPLECEHCKASFVTKANHERHQQTAQCKEEFVCGSGGCVAGFPTAELLATHQLTHQINDTANPPEKSDDGEGGGPAGGQSPLWKNLGLLEAHYGENNFPDPMDIGYIARRLEVDPLHVHMWFKERRNQHIRKLEEASGEAAAEGGDEAEGDRDGVEGADRGVSRQRALSKACTTCDAAFVCQADLTTHQAMHKSSWAQVCSVCGAEYGSVVALETHWIRHGVEVAREKDDAADAKNERSPKAFTKPQLSVLYSHYEQNNFPGATEVFLIAKRLSLRPKQVTHWFQNKRGRDRRVQNINSPYSLTCPLCGAAFISDLYLANHEKMHRTSTRHPCTECGAVFLSPVLQETHLLYHSVVPKTMMPLKKHENGSKDPLTDGQAKDEDEYYETDDSDKELVIADENCDVSGEKDGEDHDNVTDDMMEEDVNDEDHVVDDRTEESAYLEEKIDEGELLDEKIDDLENLVETEVVSESTVTRGEDEPALTADVTDLDAKPKREEIFFDDNSDSDEDSDEDEPRLKIVSAYTMPVDTEDDDLQ